jgi:metallo-beta-lactamase family protein
VISCTINNDLEISDDVTTVSYVGYGALETVGGSLHSLSIGPNNYIIDVGSFYGDNGSNYPLPSSLDVKNIDAIFITHAHADHIGRLPLLLEMGYDGPIYMTSVTKDVTVVSTLSNLKYTDLGTEEFYYSRNNNKDSKPVYLDRFNYGQYEVKTQNRVYIESKRDELNQKGFYLHNTTVDNLEMEMLGRLENQKIPINYEEDIELSDGVTAEFFYTSHLPGSSMIYFTAGDKNILFSGDIGSNNNPFLVVNKKFEKPIDYLFVEGTYGTKVTEYDTKEERQKLKEYIGNAIRNNERVIIPAFAVDRSQQVLYEIRNGIIEGTIPENTRVKVFSPTIEKITNLYSKYSENKDTYKSYFSDNMFTGIFDINNLEINPTMADSNAYNLDLSYGEIAVMTSGMISTGFSKEILKQYISDASTNFISVSYQDPDEIGGMVFNGDELIKIDDIEYEVEAKIFTSSAFGGHANVRQIFDVFGDLSPEQIIIVHLNSYDEDSLINYYSENYKSSNVIVPEISEEYLLYQY